LLRKQRKTLRGYFILPHPVHREPIHQQLATKLLSIYLPNIDRFKKLFHWHNPGTISNKQLLNIPPHLNCVALLLQWWQATSGCHFSGWSL